jgi:hypothetical protein
MTNEAAIGHATTAAKVIGLTREQIKDLQSSMRSVMDRFTEEEAEEVYRNT